MDELRRVAANLGPSLELAVVEVATSAHLTSLHCRQAEHPSVQSL